MGALESFYFFYFLNLLEVSANVLDIDDIVNIEFDFCGEESVVCLDVNAVDVYIELLGEYAGYLMQDSNAVEADDMQGCGECKLAVGVPCCCEYLVAVAGLEALCDFALPFMDDNRGSLVCRGF